MPTLICDCNRTMPLDAGALGQNLNETLTLHSTLCRREAGAFQRAVRGAEPVVVACTQEQRLFSELAEQTEGSRAQTVRFVNIRETGGWSRDARQAMPKIAALLAAAHLPEPEPVPTASYASSGRVLIIGALDAAERVAALLEGPLRPTLFATGAGNAGGAQARHWPVLSGRLLAVNGWLGAFEVRWETGNPIDLDLCTRCNACLAACPEGAIGLDYQVNLALCKSHRACVQACQAAAAINFDKAAEVCSERFDLILDLRADHATPTFLQHALPQGYLRWDGVDPGVPLRLRELVGEFEKPRFFKYQSLVCAHARNETVGCSACVDICSAEAITSLKNRGEVRVEPHLCVGCGACTTVCPTGAMTYAYPQPQEQGHRWRTLLQTYQAAGGEQATLLLHNQQRGQALVEELGRAAQLRLAHGLPHQVIPVALWHVASAGVELWLSAIAWGARQVVVLATDDDAPQYLQAIRDQMAVAQAVLRGLGFRGTHFELIQPKNALDFDADLRRLGETRQQGPVQVARFGAQAAKRATLEMALEHLMANSPLRGGERPSAIALPTTGSPLGAVSVDKSACTLCLACVGACPAGALQDNADERPELRFIEKNCVQCGLCAQTCPESAIELEPRLLLSPDRKQPKVLNAAKPYNCVRCGKPFGTLQAIEAMLGRLSGHAMFQGAAAERLKMCADCRVIDIYSATNELGIYDVPDGKNLR